MAPGSKLLFFKALKAYFIRVDGVIIIALSLTLNIVMKPIENEWCRYLRTPKSKQ